MIKIRWFLFTLLMNTSGYIKCLNRNNKYVVCGSCVGDD
jgi:hypothetical protein